MGYTHYMKQSRDFIPEEWDEIKKGAQFVVKECTKQGIELRLEDDSEEDPVINDDVIRFNGMEGNGHETFLVTRKIFESFNYCKTAGKPYDLAVTAILAITSYYSDAVRVTSDGYQHEWSEGLELAKRFIQENDEFHGWTPALTLRRRTM